MKAELLFDVTPVTLRYLQELVRYADDFLVEDFEGQEYKLETYKGDEVQPSPKTEINRNDFWSYLEELKAVKVTYPANKANAVTYKNTNQAVFYPPYHIVQFLNVEPIRDLLLMAEKQLADKHIKGKVAWDPIISKLTFKDITHTFHQGDKKDAPKLKIFNVLWDERHSKKISKKGMPMTAKMLAVRANLIDDRRGDSFTKQVEVQTIQLTKDINAILKKKKFPIRVKRVSNTFQMEIKE